jgi:ferrous iron transport protein B
MWERAFIFLKKMGTVILVGSIVIWFLSSFPQTTNRSKEFERDIQKTEEHYRMSMAQLDATSPNYKSDKTRLALNKREIISKLKAQRYQEIIYFSFIGRIGRTIEPLFRPLGFGWREAVALITGFVAKEVVVSTLGVLYNAGGEKDDELSFLLRDKSGLNPVTAYAFLVFVLIYTPCLATLAAIKQETKSFKWTLFSIFYEITLAWTLAFLIVKIGGFFMRLA